MLSRSRFFRAWRYFARSGVSPSFGATFTAVAMTNARTSVNISGSSVARCVISAATSSSDEPGLPISEPCHANGCFGGAYHSTNVQTGT